MLLLLGDRRDGAVGPVAVRTASRRRSALPVRSCRRVCRVSVVPRATPVLSVSDTRALPSAAWHPGGARWPDRTGYSGDDRRTFPRSRRSARSARPTRLTQSVSRRAEQPGDPSGCAADMTTIGFIGSGNIGGTVAGLAVAAGHDVVLSNSRGPETLAGLVAELGPQASADTATGGCRAGRHRGGQHPAARPTGRSRSSRWPARSSSTPTTTTGSGTGTSPSSTTSTTTSAGLLQDHLPTSRVVKAFNHIQFHRTRRRWHTRRHRRTAGRWPSPVTMTTAKAVVTELLDSFGYDVVDAGPLSRELAVRAGPPRLRPHLDPRGYDGGPCRRDPRTRSELLADRAGRRVKSHALSGRGANRLSSSRRSRAQPRSAVIRRLNAPHPALRPGATWDDVPNTRRYVADAILDLPVDTCGRAVARSLLR